MGGCSEGKRRLGKGTRRRVQGRWLKMIMFLLALFIVTSLVAIAYLFDDDDEGRRGIKNG